MAANPNEANLAAAPNLRAAANDALDKDTQETREWMDALTAVIESEGPERAHFLLEQLLEHARQKSIDMPFSANTGCFFAKRRRSRQDCSSGGPRRPSSRAFTQRINPTSTGAATSSSAMWMSCTRLASIAFITVATRQRWQARSRVR